MLCMAALPALVSCLDLTQKGVFARVENRISLCSRGTEKMSVYKEEYEHGRNNDESKKECKQEKKVSVSKGVNRERYQ